MYEQETSEMMVWGLEHIEGQVLGVWNDHVHVR